MKQDVEISSMPVEFDWAGADDPQHYPDLVRSAFGAGQASNEAVALHLTPPMSALESVQIEITSWCNLECCECWRTKEMAAGRWNNVHITLGRFRQIIDKLPKTRIITLQGIGEPSVHPRFVELLRIASDSGKFNWINFVTNGHTHDDRYWRCVADFKAVGVTLSVDSLDPVVAERCRSGTKTELLWHRLELFRDIFPCYNVNLVASRMNLNDIEATLRRIGTLGGVPVQITRIISENESVILQPDDEARLTACVAAARRDHPGFVIYFNANNCGLAANEKRCVAPFLSPYVTVDGYLTPCCVAVAPSHYGYIKVDDERDWDQLRSDARVAGWVDSFIQKDPAVCQGCSVNPNQIIRRFTPR